MLIDAKKKIVNFCSREKNIVVVAACGRSSKSDKLGG